MVFPKDYHFSNFKLKAAFQLGVLKKLDKEDNKYDEVEKKT